MFIQKYNLELPPLDAVISLTEQKTILARLGIEQ